MFAGIPTNPIVLRCVQLGWGPGFEPGLTDSKSVCTFLNHCGLHRRAATISLYDQERRRSVHRGCVIALGNTPVSSVTTNDEMAHAGLHDFRRNAPLEPAEA